MMLTAMDTFMIEAATSNGFCMKWIRTLKPSENEKGLNNFLKACA
jgi:hypothetical protein